MVRTCGKFNAAAAAASSMLSSSSQRALIRLATDSRSGSYLEEARCVRRRGTELAVIFDFLCFLDGNSWGGTSQRTSFAQSGCADLRRRLREDDTEGTGEGEVERDSGLSLADDDDGVVAREGVLSE